MTQTPRFIIDCADHFGFVRTAEGQKTVLTRANIYNKKSGSYSQSMPGDILELKDIQTNKKIKVQVLTVETFKSITELFNKSRIADETFNKKFKSELELKAEYENNRPGYVSLIEKHGLVAWRIKLLKK